MIYKYRVTKYDPQNRDKTGIYLKDEWTAISDVGKTYDGSVFTEEEYLRVEDSYVSSAILFLRESGIDKIAITCLENYSEYQEPRLDIQLNKVYNLEEAERLFRLVLREEIWCKFGEDSGTHVHFGYEYYMFVSVAKYCPNAIAHAEKAGLFVEPIESPYIETID